MWRDEALMVIRKLVPCFALTIYSLLGGALFFLLSRGQVDSPPEELKGDNTTKALLRASCRLSYWESLYFASSIYTTIGNAKVHVCSNFEKVAAIIYAILGIPLNYVVIINLGDVIEHLSSQLWRLFCRNPLFNKVHPSSPAGSSTPANVLRLLTGVLLSIMAILTMAYLFSLTEDWGFGTSLYFVASSVTTLGYDNNVKNHFDYTVVYQAGLILGLAITWIYIRKLERLYKDAFQSLNRILHVSDSKSPSGGSMELSVH